MMRVMSDAEVAEHQKRLAYAHSQMPPDVHQAIAVLKSWIALPDYWDEAVDRGEAVRWFVIEELDLSKHKFRPLPDRNEG